MKYICYILESVQCGGEGELRHRRRELRRVRVGIQMLHENKMKAAR